MDETRGAGAAPEVAPVLLSRHLDAPRALVFEAWSSADHLKRWFSPKTYTVPGAEVDLRPGGRERLQGRWAHGVVSTFDAVYHDVVADRRLLYSYEMRLEERKISVSLATVELYPQGGGTRLIVTEQGAFLDGYDDAGSRERGTGFLLDRLAQALA